MRKWRRGLGWMVAAAFGAAGCTSTNIVLKPPKHPEEIVVPPSADSKFSLPPKYPPETLNRNDPVRPSTIPGGPGSMGGGGMGGMGGMPMGGMGGMPMGGMGGMGMMGPMGMGGMGR